MEQQSINTTLIKKLLKYSEKKQISKEEAGKLTDKIVEQIDNGQLSISDPQADYDNYINQNIKQEALKNIYQSDEYYNYERDIRIMKGMTISQIEAVVPKKGGDRKKIIKQEQQIKHKKSEIEIKKQFMAKVKRWEEERAKILKRKRDIEAKKKSLEISSEEKAKKESEEINAFLKLEKQKIIEAKMRDLNQRKAKRHQDFQQQAPVKKILSLPKYVQAEQRFKSQQHQKQLQKQIILKNRKQQLQIKMQQIKQHERLYIQRIKERLNMHSQNSKVLNKSNDSISKSIESFNLNKKDPAELKKIEEKIKRMKQIENKIKLMPLKIDPEKQKEIEIIGDKLKNKKKYHFLSQKALSDELIYQEFKDFDINIDKKELGNQYFEEMKQINKKLGHRKVSSQRVLPANRPQYKDYIKEMREKKGHVLNPDQFDSVAKKLSKSKDVNASKNYLLAKSQQFEEKAIEKIHELKKMQNYHDAVRKEEEIDKNYMKAIQAKLALAKIQ